MNDNAQSDRTKQMTQQTGWRARLCLAGLSCILSLGAPAKAANKFDAVYISEFLADNHHSVEDSFGEHQGWIELHNAGSEVVNLEGWYLSDARANPMKWAFPGVSILPGGYLVVFASGKDIPTNLAELHTNFRLGKD
jgi:hypothetical protein